MTAGLVDTLAIAVRLGPTCFHEARPCHRQEVTQVHTVAVAARRVACRDRLWLALSRACVGRPGGGPRQWQVAAERAGFVVRRPPCRPAHQQWRHIQSCRHDCGASEPAAGLTGASHDARHWRLRCCHRHRPPARSWPAYHRPVPWCCRAHRTGLARCRRGGDRAGRTRGTGRGG